MNAVAAPDDIIELKLRQPHFDNVVSKQKTVDGRILFDALRKILKIGCWIKFTCGLKFVLKNLSSFQPYNGFRGMLKVETVAACLPNIRNGDINVAVRAYHKLIARGESYQTLAKRHGVVALRLGEVTLAPYQALTRTELRGLAKVVKSPTTSQCFVKVGSGTFANVFKIKHVKCEYVLGLMNGTGNQSLKKN